MGHLSKKYYNDGFILSGLLVDSPVVMDLWLPRLKYSMKLYTFPFYFTIAYNFCSDKKKLSGSFFLNVIVSFHQCSKSTELHSSLALYHASNLLR